VHLRAHHPSDVAGGAAIGAALGLLLRPVARVLAPGSARRSRHTAKGMGPAGYVLKKL
jgi:membrane-associated phospholipid phosphatase